jgi:hypothetical protein
MKITNGEVSAFAGSETSPSCLGLGMWSWDCTWFCGPAFDLDGTAYVHWLLYMESSYTKIATVWTTAGVGTRGNYDSFENIEILSVMET